MRVGGGIRSVDHTVLEFRTCMSAATVQVRNGGYIGVIRGCIGRVEKNTEKKMETTGFFLPRHPHSHCIWSSCLCKFKSTACYRALGVICWTLRDPKPQSQALTLGIQVHESFLHWALKSVNVSYNGALNSVNVYLQSALKFVNATYIGLFGSLR